MSRLTAIYQKTELGSFRRYPDEADYLKIFGFLYFGVPAAARWKSDNQTVFSAKKIERMSFISG
ncbi:MAG TPA: hypothetical protein VF599_03140 [Pyrinomonadaceae bacterium]|jgi:hypothetical protein